MRRALVTVSAFVMAGAAAAAPPVPAEDCGKGCEPRLNEIQILGTSDSYKLRPDDAMLSLIRMGGDSDAAELDYALPPLAGQLDAGVRSLEFDIAYDPKGGLFKNPAGASMAGEVLDPAYVAAMSVPGFKTIHVMDVDFNASCLTLKMCLSQVADWSAHHKGHAPIVIVLHADDRRTPMPGATRPLAFDAAAMNALEGEVLGAFGADTLITPDLVRGDAATLRDGLASHGWPRLNAARDKMMFVFEGSPEAVAAYAFQGARHGLEGRAMFVAADEASPLAAFVTIDDPRKDAERIAADVKAGFIVRTRADENAAEARDNDGARRAAAFASGAQIVATDFPLPDAKIGAYKVSLSDDPRYSGGDFAVLPAPGLKTAKVP